ncbi:DUF1450 domain-containing protein [Alicyclobacillus ferrooxydans]|uniref:UDP-N-acetylmuramoylalanine--D-glutamate ligase n=1 Tax=Alicyclobacillus ferrooxydans TaxID=471514 RepID=A0A0P9D1X9_9BACL|nr:DUF1450 domain-containing protein [Alicyclobacillus ferrooxydans]KPV43540.1 hypothetical protein AN477_12085 [Alicyclobacillus ferrooxydans]
MYGGFILLEVCDANPAATSELYGLENEYPGLSVMENSCMSECELCAARPYVFLNGELLAASPVEDLMLLIRSRLNQLFADDTETSM